MGGASTAASGIVTTIAAGFFAAAWVMSAACACGLVVAGEEYRRSTLKSDAACCAPFFTSAQNGSNACPWVTIAIVIRLPAAVFAGVAPGVPWLERPARIPTTSNAAAALILLSLMKMPPIYGDSAGGQCNDKSCVLREPPLSIPVDPWCREVSRGDAPGRILTPGPANQTPGAHTLERRARTHQRRSPRHHRSAIGWVVPNLAAF